MPAREVLPSTPLSDFSYEELDGSPTHEYEVRGVTGERRFKVRWDQRSAFAVALRGTIRSAGSTMQLVMPHAFPGHPKCYCRGVGIQPFGRVGPEGTVWNYDTGAATSVGSVTGAASYPFAEVRARYTTLEGPGELGGMDAPAMVEESLEPFAEFITLSHQKLYWAPANTTPLKEAEAPQRLIRGVDWVYKILYASSVPPETFSLVGCCNNAQIISRTLGVTFDTETLLYNPPVLSRTWMGTDVDMVTAWNLEYRFSYRPEGWNKFYKEGVEAPATVYKAGGGIFKPYTPASFANLVFA